MRIIGASSSVSTFTRQAAGETSDGAAAQVQGTRLMTIEPPRRNDHPRLRLHPSGPFVAHLLATRMQAPQTRERRRAEPAEAIAVYRSMTKPVTAQGVFRARV
ncbi:MAG: hypothetical protein WDO17_26855 [Alphaproteobacteria bacterium]